MFFFVMILRTPIYTRTDPRLPYTTLFRSQPPFRSSRMNGAERQPTSDCRQSLQQSHGTYRQCLDVNRNDGSIKSFKQELSLANDARSSFRWVVGANYEHSRVREDDEVNYADSTSSYVNTQVIGQDYDQAGYNNRQRLKNYAVFGNVEYDISDQLTLKG